MNNVAKNKRRANTKDKPQSMARERPQTRSVQSTRLSDRCGQSARQVKEEPEAQNNQEVPHGSKRTGAPTLIDGTKRGKRTVICVSDTSDSDSDSCSSASTFYPILCDTSSDTASNTARDTAPNTDPGTASNTRRNNSRPSQSQESRKTQHRQKIVAVLGSGKIYSRCAILNCQNKHNIICRMQRHCYDKTKCQFVHIEWMPNLITLLQKITTNFMELHERLMSQSFVT